VETFLAILLIIVVVLAVVTGIQLVRYASSGECGSILHLVGGCEASIPHWPTPVVVPGGGL